MEHGGGSDMSQAQRDGGMVTSQGGALPVNLGGWHGEIDVLNKKAIIYVGQEKEFRFNANESGQGPLQAVMEGAEVYIREEEGGVWVVGIKGLKKGFSKLKITWAGALVTEMDVKCVEQDQTLKISREVVGKLIGILEIIRILIAIISF